MNTAVTVAREQYAERIRSMIWNDMVAGRVPTTVTGFSALGEHVDVNDYLLRAALPAGDPAAVGTWVAGVVDLVDEWIRTDVVRLRYGAFTSMDVSLLTDYLQGVARSQHDVEIIARLAGEW